MSLADARAKRAELREAKDRGLDPKTILAGVAFPTKALTFRRDVSTFISHMCGQWTATHLKEWQQSMDRIAGPLMDKATASLTQADVLGVIEPVWGTTNETARRVLGRIDQTIEHAIAVDPARFSGSNPCINVLRFLPRVSAVVKPRPAMPWRGSARLLRRVAAAPGDSSTRTRAVVARLLPKNQRGRPSDVERDRRQSMERACGTYEVRCRADDPPEPGCDHSAREH